MRYSGQVVSVVHRNGSTFGTVLQLPTEERRPGLRQLGWFVASERFDLGTVLLLDVEHSTERPLRTEGESESAVLLRFEGVQVLRATQTSANVSVPAKWVSHVQDAVRRPLYPYQGVGAAWVASRLWSGKGSLLADEQGLGKSPQAVAAIVSTRLYPALLVCPTSLKTNWFREFQHANRPPVIHKIEGRSGPLPRAEVYLINYDILAAREKALSAIPFKALVLDEGHLVNEPRPSPMHRASVVTRLAHRIGRTAILTGTPLENRPEELWRLLHMLDPHVWPNFEEYRLRYCKAPSDEDEAIDPGLVDDRVVTSYGRLERQSELLAKVAPLILRRRKADVQQDLPPKFRRVLHVDLEPEDRRVYTLAEEDVVKWLRAQGEGARASAAIRATALVRLTYLRKIAAIGKLRRVAPEYLRAWFSRAPRTPLMVFAHHTEVIRGVAAIATRLGLRPIVIDGSTPGASRQGLLDAFERREADLCVGSLRSAGVGLNIQWVSDLLFLERDWAPFQMVQAEDRAHRHGQGRPVLVTTIDAADTVDDHIAATLAGKQVLIDNVIDGTRTDLQAEAKAEQVTVDAVIERFLRGAR